MCKSCHVVSVEIELRSLDAIKKACKRQGWTFKEGQQTYRWVGKWYDDSPVPRNLFETEEEYQRVLNMPKPVRCAYMKNALGHCTHAIQVPTGHGEIGLIEREGRF